MDYRLHSSIPNHAFKTRTLLTIALVVFWQSVTAAQQPDTLRIDPIKLGIVGVGTVGVVAYSQIQQSQQYWGTKSAFHTMPFEMEYKDALLADKLGHFYFTSMAATGYRGLLEWTGMDSIQAQWWGSGVALAFQIGVEIQDGFAGGQSYLGFSWGDILADVGGAALPVLQVKYPWLQNVTSKISFDPNDHDPATSGSYLDDYQSTYHWYSINIYNLLPEAWQQWYPRIVNLAIGHSVKGLDRNGAGYHEFYVSLDWNLEALPGDTWFLRSLKRTFNLYHLPAPAVRISPGVVWFGLKL